jgi:hypothetical protein
VSFIVIDVGCLECGAPTTSGGTYDTVEAAKASVTGNGGWVTEAAHDWGGEGRIVIFDTTADPDCGPILMWMYR